MREKARDARRLSDIAEIKKALEMYYDDNGGYPPVNYAQSHQVSWTTLSGYLEAYISLPSDPVNISPKRYLYDADPGDNYQTYGLMLAFEHSSNFDIADTDGGSYNRGNGEYYETGMQHLYCMETYGGNWWGAGTTVCSAGN